MLVIVVNRILVQEVGVGLQGNVFWPNLTQILVISRICRRNLDYHTDNIQVQMRYVLQSFMQSNQGLQSNSMGYQADASAGRGRGICSVPRVGGRLRRFWKVW